MKKNLPPPGLKTIIEIDLGEDEFYLKSYDIIDENNLLLIYINKELHRIPVIVNFKEMSYIIMRPYLCH